MGLTRCRLGDYIKRSTVNNRDLKYGSDLIAGVTSDGVFTKPKGDVSDVDLSPYKIVENGAFVYNPSRLDLGSIAYRTGGMCIVSHLYVVFYLTEEGKNQIDPIYLFVYFRRNEFHREVTFRNWGSQRSEFGFDDMSEIEIDLPPIEVQRRYAAIYEGLNRSRTSIENVLSATEHTAHVCIESNVRDAPVEPLASYIVRHDERNMNNLYSNVKGVSTSKTFREPTAKVDRTRLMNYKVVRPRWFSFVQTTHNERVFANALNLTDAVILVSPVNEVFSADETRLLPEYLYLIFSRPEFDRYARFHSWGSARETFTWADLQETRVPIPSLEVQSGLADLYAAINRLRSLYLHLNDLLQNICPVLIKGSIDEARREG